MILEYHRPAKIDEVLALLARADPLTIPVGGGTTLERFSTRPVAVVDLQALGLDKYQRQGNMLQIGATLTLQRLAEALEKEKLALLAGLKQAIGLEATFRFEPGQRSSAIAVNQLGYLPEARKLALVGEWLGSAGPMPIAAAGFELLDPGGRLETLQVSGLGAPPAFAKLHLIGVFVVLQHRHSSPHPVCQDRGPQAKKAVVSGGATLARPGIR